MTLDEEELKKRTDRINGLCALIEALAQDNGNVGEYLSALHICVGRCLRGMPHTMREGVMQKFFLEVRRAVKGEGIYQ